MRILFLCGSLEPGRDGVGDYTRRLAAELIRQGHEAAAVALNDPFATEVLLSRQETEENALAVYRIPSAWPANKRFAAATQWLEQYNPDWLSLQFVPFGFNEKGLPFGLSKWLNSLGKGRRWHIMFHELWVGMDEESSAKHFWWGRLQKELIRSVITKLRPRVIHTQTCLYQSQLKKLGFASGYLPLFANIPHAYDASGNAFDKSNDRNVKNICFVNFGSIHPGAPVQDLAKEAALYQKNNGVSIHLKMIGRCGPEQDKWRNVWQAEGLGVEVLGEKPQEYISKVLGTATIGLSTTPIALAEKSGSVAAMREHHLPVLCVSRKWNPRYVAKPVPPDGIAEYRVGHLETYLTGKRSVAPGINVSDVSRQFINTLLATE